MPTLRMVGKILKYYSQGLCNLYSRVSYLFRFPCLEMFCMGLLDSSMITSAVEHIHSAVNDTTSMVYVAKRSKIVVVVQKLIDLISIIYFSSNASVLPFSRVSRYARLLPLTL